LEVGLGGRLDATNVIPIPAATGITTLDFDHVNVLGGTIQEIGKEKAGIIKYPLPAIVAQQVVHGAIETIQECAIEEGVSISVARSSSLASQNVVARDYDAFLDTVDSPSIGSDPIASSGSESLATEPTVLGLCGRFQLGNASLAAALCESFWRQFGQWDLVREGKPCDRKLL